MEIVSTIISALSLLVALYAAIVANLPYIKNLSVSETFSTNENSYRFSISNIGREAYFPKYIEIIDVRKNKSIGLSYFSQKGTKLYAIAPGEIRNISVKIDDSTQYKHTLDVNPQLIVVITDIKGRKSIFKNVFMVG